MGQKSVRNVGQRITDPHDGKAYRLFRDTGDDSSIVAARRLRTSAARALKHARSAGAGAEVLAQLTEAARASEELYVEMDPERRLLASKRPASSGKVRGRKSKPDDGSIEAARAARSNASARLCRARKAEAGAEVLEPLHRALQASEELYQQRSLDVKAAKRRIPDDGSIAAASKLHRREVAKLHRRKATADEEELAKLKLAVHERSTILKSRLIDPVHAEEREHLRASKRSATKRTTRGSTPALDDGTIAAALRAREKARARLRSAHRAEASDEVLAPLQSAFHASQQVYTQRYADPRNAQEAEAMRARQRVMHAAWRGKRAAKGSLGLKAAKRRISDGGTIAAARRTRETAKGRLRRARSAAASADVLAQLESAYETSKEEHEHRLRDPRNAQEAAAIPKRAGRDPPRLPDDSSIPSALRSHGREAALRRALRKRGASEEELAAADAAVREAWLVVKSRRGDPVNYEERDPERRLLASKRPASSGKVRGRKPKPDDGSIEAARAARSNASARLRRARKAEASDEVLAPLQSAFHASQQVYTQRYADPRNAHEAEAMRARQRVMHAAWRGKRAAQGSLGLKAAKRRIPDDGSIAAASKLHRREVAKLHRRKATADEEELAKLELAVHERSTILESRLNEPHNAGERERLQANRRSSSTARGPTPAPDDGTIAAARRARDAARFRLRSARKAEAGAEALAPLQSAFQASQEVYTQRRKDPRNAHEAEAMRARARARARVAVSAQRTKRLHEAQTVGASEDSLDGKARSRKLSAKAEELARLELAVHERSAVIESRLNDPVSAEEKERLPPSRKRTPRQSTQTAAPDDGSITAADRARAAARDSLLNARQAGASAKVLIQLKSAHKASEEVYTQRFCDPGNAQEVEDILAGRTVDSAAPPTVSHPPSAKPGPRGRVARPDDGSVAAARRVYRRHMARRFRLRAAGASTESIAQADQAARSSLKIWAVRRANSLSAEEREELRDRWRSAARKRSRHGPALKPDDGSIAAAFRTYDRLKRHRYKLETSGASAADLAEADAAWQKSRKAYNLRRSDPANAEEQARLVGKPIKRAASAPRGEDDGSIVGASNMYNREFQKKKAKESLASKHELEEMYAALTRFRALVTVRYLDPANAEERRSLPAYYTRFGRHTKKTPGKPRTSVDAAGRRGMSEEETAAAFAHSDGPVRLR